MADVQLKKVGKSYAAVEVIKSIDLEIKHGEFIVFVGPSGCGKSTLLRMIAGLEEIYAWRTADRRQTLQRHSAARPRHRDGVPVLCALSAHDRLRQCRLRAQAGQGSLERAGRQDTRRGAHPSDGTSARSQTCPAVRRPAPAGRHRARHRPAAGGLPFRRAPFEPRCRTARRHANGDRTPAPGAGGHHGLCDSRPGRGNDPGRQDRRAGSRRRSTGRRAAGTIPSARQPVRGRVHRLAEDEPPAGQCDRSGRANHRDRIRRRQAPLVSTSARARRERSGISCLGSARTP